MTVNRPLSMLALMTFNIRYGLADDGINIWENRKALVVERIRASDPDLIGMQECRDDFQAEFIKENLPEYEFYGVPRGGGSVTALEMAPILFKKSVFQLIRQGCFWLSEIPHVPGSVSWGATFPRTATWVELVHLASGRKLFFLNAHFDYAPSAIEKSAYVLNAWIDQNAGNCPLLLTGDFNADKNSSAYRQLTEHGNLQDIYRTGVSDEDEENEGTFHGYGKANDPIDWMLASRHFEVVHTGIDRHHLSGLYPSDHFPANAVMRWKRIS